MVKSKKWVTRLALLSALIITTAIIGIACSGGDGAENSMEGSTPSAPDHAENTEVGSNTTAPTTNNTIDTIKNRGNLICGVKVDTPGFGVLNADGSRSGNDVEYCRAIAAAVFGSVSNNNLTFIEATGANRFELLARGEIDVLVRTTTWTASRDAGLNAAFAPTTFYDGAGVMVLDSKIASQNISSVADLDGATICILDGTSTQGAIQDFATENNITLTQQTFQENAPLSQAFQSGQCDGWSSDKSQLGGHQFSLSQNGIAATVLPDTLSKEPLGPAVRDGDNEWLDVVTWIVNGMIIAEEQGVTQANVDAMVANPPNNTVARLLGVGFKGGASSDLGIGHGKLANDVQFMQDVLRAVGNYGEVYARTLEPVGLARAGSPNANFLLTGGGLIYSPPMR